MACTSEHFAGLFLSTVAGFIFVDASRPEAFHPLLPSLALRQGLIPQRDREAPWLFFKVGTGLATLSGDYYNPNTSQRSKRTASSSPDAYPANPSCPRSGKGRRLPPGLHGSWLGEWDYFDHQQSSLTSCHAATQYRWSSSRKIRLLQSPALLTEAAVEKPDIPSRRSLNIYLHGG